MSSPQAVDSGLLVSLCAIKEPWSRAHLPGFRGDFQSDPRELWSSALSRLRLRVDQAAISSRCVSLSDARPPILPYLREF